jgi:hypothetical protein
MNVTIRQILDAVPAMNKLVTADLPLRTAHRLALLTGKLNPHLDFFQKKQAALEAKGGEGAEEALQALLDYQVELEEERIDISLGEELLLSAVDVNGLLPFVRFVEGEAQQA